VSIRLVLADDHPLFLDGLASLFSGDGYTIEARCASGDEAIAAVRAGGPDVLVVGLHMPGTDGIAVARTLAEEEMSARIVVMADHIDEAEALECLRLGVAGMVLKDMPSELVRRCVDKVAAGELWYEKQSFGNVLEHLLRREAALQGPAAGLSVRELEVIVLCAEGRTNAEIASALWLTEGTVKTHLHHIYQKLGIRGRAELTRFAIEHRLARG
jgi:two-component system, NarL family, nitrate/nitrite response regulator NarL